MSYTLHTDRTSPWQSARSAYGYDDTPDAITHHWWGLPEWRNTAAGVVDFLCDPNRAPSTATSAHYVISGTHVWCIVAPSRAAWHSGSGEGNGRSIGLEIDPNLPAGTLETVAQLCADLEETFGALYHFGHLDWFATQCPGTVYNLIPGIIKRTNEILAGGKPAAPQAPSGSTAPKLQPSVPAAPRPVVVPSTIDKNGPYWDVERGDSLARIARYYNGPSVAEIAAYNGIKNPARIETGQRIYIPGPLVWLVERGDTGNKISAHYGIPWATIKANNGLQSDVLQPGQIIKIWGAS